jgi:methylthioribose-1-phosphate isomerase
MAADFELRQDDVGRRLTVQIRNADGTFVQLAAGSTAVFRMKGRRTGTVVTGAASISSSGGLTNNELTYIFVAGNSAVIDLYDGVFITTDPSANVETFPTCSTPGPQGFTVEVCPKI